MHFFAARTTVTGDLGIPEQQRYIEKVEELEAYHNAQQYRNYQPEPQESYAPPEFKTPIKDQLNIRENAFAHFEARLEPLGDPTLRVEWFKDGRPVEASMCQKIRFSEVIYFVLIFFWFSIANMCLLYALFRLQNHELLQLWICSFDHQECDNI